MGDIIKSLFPEDKSKSGIKLTKKQSKYIIGLFMLILVGISIMSFSESKPPPQDTPLHTVDSNSNGSASNYTSSLVQLEQFMENRLQQILAQIEGVGQVAINITMDSSVELQYAVNTKVDRTVIDEQAQDGSTRTTNDTREDAQVVMKNMTQGKNEPVVIKEIRPQVAGVVVVAEGANDILLREKISQAVQTALDIPAHRVTVLPKGK